MKQVRAKITSIQQKIRKKQRQEYMRVRRMEMIEQYDICQPDSFSIFTISSNIGRANQGSLESKTIFEGQYYKIREFSNRKIKDFEQYSQKINKLKSLSEAQAFIEVDMHQIKKSSLTLGFKCLDYLLTNILEGTLFISIYEENKTIDFVCRLIDHMKRIVYLVSHSKNQNQQILQIDENFFGQNWRKLLQMGLYQIISRIISLSYELAINGLIIPNYHLVRFLLNKRTNHIEILENIEFQKFRQQQYRLKIENIIVLYLKYYKIQQNSKNKLRNIHHHQIVYDYIEHIKNNISKIYYLCRIDKETIKTLELQQHFKFCINLYNQLIHKFLNLNKTKQNHSTENELTNLLFSKELLEILQSLIFILKNPFISQNIEMTLSLMIYYLLGVPNRARISEQQRSSDSDDSQGSDTSFSIQDYVQELFLLIRLKVASYHK